MLLSKVKSHIFKSASLFFALVFSACSDTEYVGYTPRGEERLRKTYGYSDQKVSANAWDVQFVSQSPKKSRTGAMRRAQEVCIANGFTGAVFNPTVAAVDDLVMASGRAQCSAKGASTGRLRATREMRLQDIDAEIAALRGEQRSAVASHSVLTQPLSFAISVGKSTTWNRDIEQRIADLSAKRARLMLHR